MSTALLLQIKWQLLCGGDIGVGCIPGRLIVQKVDVRLLRSQDGRFSIIDAP
jgi:hypothetical protein